MKKGLLLLLFFIFTLAGLAENADTTKTQKHPNNPNCEQQAVGDLLRKKSNTSTKPPRKMSALVLPNLSSNPTNGFMFGVGGALGWYMGDKATTKVSSAAFVGAVTTKNQLITTIKSNIYTRENKFFLQGDWRFYLYSQPTYGLGTNAPDSVKLPNGVSWMGESAGKDSAIFPMKFNNLKIVEIVNKNIIGDLYAGVGFNLDYYYSIVDEKYRPATDSTPLMITPYHYYTDTNNFNLNKSIVSGISLNVVYDTRDNQISPFKGYYANINYRINPTWMGSDQSSSSLWVEFRTYVNVRKKTPRNVVAFWLFGDFVLTGKVPYLTLPYLGEDQRARSGRGYTNGRFRGNNIVYGEVEWRFPISQCSKILGGVLFVNATTTSNPNNGVKLFQYVRPAVGCGLRVMINKYFRTNINLDFAIGKESKGFYFSGQETF
jgi:hypothetical protein